MGLPSVPTRGRTLDHAAFIYDTLEPFFLLGKQGEYDRQIVSLLELTGTETVLDLGCGTGVLTQMIADRLQGNSGAKAIGIDAAGKMIEIARKKRASSRCGFEVNGFTEKGSFPGARWALA